MYVLEDADTLSLESVRKGQIATALHGLIKTLSLVVRTECDYMDICDSLGVPLEYGPLAIPKYRTWDVANWGNFDKVLFMIYKLFI